jgi:hypothetical protein
MGFEKLRDERGELRVGSAESPFDRLRALALRLALGLSRINSVRIDHR